MGVPPNGGFIRENLIKMDDLGVPPFQEIPIFTYSALRCWRKLGVPVATNSVEVFRFYGWIGVTLGGTGLSPKRSKSQTSAVKWRICSKISPNLFFQAPKL